MSPRSESSGLSVDQMSSRLSIDSMHLSENESESPKKEDEKSERAHQIKKEIELTNLLVLIEGFRKLGVVDDKSGSMENFHCISNKRS